MDAPATQARRQHARADTKSLTNWKLVIARGIVASILTLLVVALTGLPTDGASGQLTTVAIFAASVALVLGAEYGGNYLLADGRLAKDEADRLRAENAELRANQEDVASVRQLQQQQAELSQERIAQLEGQLAIFEAQSRVFRDIAEEEHRTGRKVPFEAMMARLQVSTQVATGDFGN